ncbi:alpha/beta hydrolase [Variovorax robiniae]|uniref:Alpha/beta hydrolase n=1 Tax=Variovorax robiniae TaxID=1836199 RepID=A0ABU8XJD3_9BURK
MLLKPPSKWLLLAEGRALWEAGAALALWPLLQSAPRGDGHSVLVLPGLVADDMSTEILRQHLGGRGYDVHGWGQGRNLGPRRGVEARMREQLARLYADSGHKVSLIGWSLGGVYARLLAIHAPHMVRNVITLGSPLGGDPKATNAWQVYRAVSGDRGEDTARLAEVAQVPAMPATSIYSRSDGVVAWRSSITPAGPCSENIEVVASHLGLGAHPAVLYALADRLAQAEGSWKPFNGTKFGPLAFPTPRT